MPDPSTGNSPSTLVLPTLKVAGLYAVIRWFINLALKRWGSVEFTKASAARQHRAILYILSTINALIMVAYHLIDEVPRMVKRKAEFADMLTAVHAIDAESKLSTLESASIERAVGEDGQESHERIVLSSRHATEVDDLQRLVEAKRKHVAALRKLLLAFNGYFVHDLIASGPEGWRQYPVDIVHHFLGIGIVSNTILRLEHCYPFCSIVMFPEVSTIFLNLMWLCREFPQSAARLLRICGLAALGPATSANTASATPLVEFFTDKVFARLFFGFFTYTRIYGMTAILWKANTTAIPATSLLQSEKEQIADGRRKQLVVADRMLGPWGNFVLIGATALQYYWFVLIVKKLFFRP